MDASVSVAFRAPDPALQPFISTYYELSIKGDALVEDYLHPEWANIRMALDRPWIMGRDAKGAPIQQGALSVLHGPTSRPTYVLGSGRTFGIGILPTGWSRLWSLDATPYANAIVPLSDVIGQLECAALDSAIQGAVNLDERKTIADRFLLARMARAKLGRMTPQIDRLFALLLDPDNATVEHLMNILALPHARLVRLCKRGFGFPPKLLLRRQRFLRMLGAMHARPYGEWRDFIDPQYVDQSHLVRDFQFFLGMSPSAYFALPRPILAAAARTRAAMFGQPLQGLHPIQLGT